MAAQFKSQDYNQANDRPYEQQSQQQQQQRAQPYGTQSGEGPPPLGQRIVTTETTTTTTTTQATTAGIDPVGEASTKGQARSNRQYPKQEAPHHHQQQLQQHQVAIVEELGRQASRHSLVEQSPSNNTNRRQEEQQSSNNSSNLIDFSQVSNVEGNKSVTSIGTIAAQSSQSRIVVALLKDGDERLQLKIQEMRPSIFEVGSNLVECQKFCQEHQRIMKNLNQQRQAPLECWLNKYQKIQLAEPQMSTQMKLVYMCMAENLQGCWRALLAQLEQRLHILQEACKFYELADRLRSSLEAADNHVQSFRQAFLDGPGSMKFNQACNELRRMNQTIMEDYQRARNKQQQLVQLIGQVATNNLGDSRTNQLISDGQALINYINTYLDPLERRKVQLENVIITASTTNTTSSTRLPPYDNNNNNNVLYNRGFNSRLQTNNISTNKQPLDTINGNNINNNYYSSKTTKQTSTTTTGTRNNNNNLNTSTSANGGSISYNNGSGGGKPILREITSFNDLNLVENWLRLKTDQLNSSLLSSLGVSVQDSRSILSKHEQIALECSAIEEACLQFNGKNIHALKQIDPRDDKQELGTQKSLFEQQKLLATKTRDVINILDARIVLLRRTIDFYIRAKDATGDINKMMRRLQIDNSLQSVQYVANELELKDVSSVVASGATIISELQQLQLAQRHGQRSDIVNLNLLTNGIRTIIDQLNQELAHLKTVLNQRKLVLLNEDATKMANNFSNKCHQLHGWLNNHAKSYLLSNNRVGTTTTTTTTNGSILHYEDGLHELRQYLEGHEQLRLAIQNKTPEVEALLRLLSTLIESFDAKSQVADEIQRDTDELRQDWISVTNCLDKRLELARKYQGLLMTSSVLAKELDSLDPKSRDRCHRGQPQRTTQDNDASGRPKTPDERSDADIWSNIEQSLVQLENQVKNFSIDCQRGNTSLVYVVQSASGTKSTVVNDINKEELVKEANEMLKNLLARRDLLSKNLKDNSNNNNNNTKRSWSSNKITSVQKQRPRDQAAATTNTTMAATTETTTTTTTTERKVNETTSSNNKPATSSQPQPSAPIRSAVPTNRVPIFLRPLGGELEVEPFSTIELECELEPDSVGPELNCKIEWLMNNYKKIPPNIKHSLQSYSPTRFSLIIRQFSSLACGTYTVKVTNLANGQWATSSCNLRLAGIEENSIEEETTTGQSLATGESKKQQASLSSKRNNQIRPTASRPQTGAAHATTATPTPTPVVVNLDRIVQSVGDERANDVREPGTRTSKTTASTTTTTATTATTTTTAIGDNGGHQAQQQQVRINYIDSPASRQASSTASGGRSLSRSPYCGELVQLNSQQMQQQQQDGGGDGASGSSRCCSRNSLVCVVVGAPPPTVQWTHNSKPIAQVRCSPTGAVANTTAATARQTPRGNIGRLTIETTPWASAFAPRPQLNYR